jgi:prepilin-type N-terminal cleavage/methylation domain-containing protein
MLPRRHCSGGYTLIEVLVSIVILGIGLSGVIAAFAYTSMCLRGAQDQVRAQNLVTEKIEELRAASFQDVDDVVATEWSTPVDSSPEGRFAQQLRDAQLTNAIGRINVQTLASNLKGVTVSIDWYSGVPGAHVELSTLISPRL